VPIFKKLKKVIKPKWDQECEQASDKNQGIPIETTSVSTLATRHPTHLTPHNNNHRNGGHASLKNRMGRKGYLLCKQKVLRE